MTIQAKVYRKFNRRDSDLRAFGEVVLDGVLVVKVRVIEGAYGLYIAYPSHKDRRGEYHDTAFPITGQFHRGIEKAVLDAYAGC